MGLNSQFFGGDKKLEAAQTNDAAHVTIGASGPHVAKVQIALAALDDQKIDSLELKQQRYGPSTAKAVQRFKKRREIINHAYQSAADDVVGKMTISRLDLEMVLFEAVHKPIDECTLAGPSAVGTQPGLGINTTRANATRSSLVTGKGKPQFNRVLRVMCQITRKSAIEDGYPIRQDIETAKEILREFGLSLSVEFATSRSNFADTIDFPQTLVLEEDVTLLRQASENVRPGLTSILRIIVARRSVNGNPGQTFRGITSGTTTFQPFVILNSQSTSRDHATFLHEMIHAANLRSIKHDKEFDSVFFENAHNALGDVDRRFLKEEHARTMAGSFFAL